MHESPLLSVVPYSPSDFSLGKALGTVHGEQLVNADLISAAISLYWQWPQYRSAGVRLTTVSAENLPCDLIIDEEEVSPTEIRIKFKNVQAAKFHVGQVVVIQFEVFNVGYSFDAKILLCTDGTQSGRFDLVVDVPAKLVVSKLRAMPRVYIAEERVADFVCCVLMNGPVKDVKLVLTEVGPTSFVARCDVQIVDGTVLVSLGDQVFSCRVSRRAEHYIFEVNVDNEHDYGRFFAVYARFAFPTLRPKFDYPLEDTLRAYVEAGYLDKYIAEMTDQQKSDFCALLVQTWKSVSFATHEKIEDYCAVDEMRGKITGASSVTLSFYKDERPVWVITQYASLAIPEYFQQTKELYLWRAAYLWGRPGALDVVCWIDSKSRWLERIWVKFTRYRAGKDECIWPVVLRIWNNESAMEPFQQEVVKSQKFGSAVRHYLFAPGFLGGADPKRLNVSMLHNQVFAVPPSDDIESLCRLASALTASSGEKNPDIRITLPARCSNALENLLIHPNQDRMCYFSKDDLPYYFSSLCHSLAVIERKNREFNVA